MNESFLRNRFGHRGVPVLCACRSVLVELPPWALADRHGTGRAGIGRWDWRAKSNPGLLCRYRFGTRERDSTRWLTCPSHHTFTVRPTRTSGWVGVVHAASACCGRA
jgi:hypothetical protein